MINLNILEELRTRKEVEYYFKQLGKNITEEEIDILKQNYEQAEENNDALSMKQLNDVAGGLCIVAGLSEDNGTIRKISRTINQKQDMKENIYAFSDKSGRYAGDRGYIFINDGLEEITRVFCDYFSLEKTDDKVQLTLIDERRKFHLDISDKEKLGENVDKLLEATGFQGPMPEYLFKEPMYLAILESYVKSTGEIKQHYTYQFPGVGNLVEIYKELHPKKG